MDMNVFYMGVGVGIVVGVFVAAIAVLIMINLWKPKRTALKASGKGANLKTPLFSMLLVGVTMFGLAFQQVQVSFAQATPVPLVIPVNDIFVQANNWMQTFSPIVSIGIGISLALAILGFLGVMIKSAFK